MESLSDTDVRATRKIREACGFVDLRLLDHIIVSGDGYYSFGEAGK